MSRADPRRRRPPEVRRRLAISLSVGLLLLVGALTTAFPLLWMVAGSFKPQREAIDFPPTLLPQDPTFANYARLFTELDFGRYLVNTVLVVLVGAFGLLFMAMAGYAFAKFRFRGKGGMFFLVLATLM